MQKKDQIILVKIYTGGISDKEITAISEILDLLEKMMMSLQTVILNSGSLKGKNAGLVISPFLGAKGKLSKNVVSMTHTIAHLQTNVKRAIRRVKEYHIFDGVNPLAPYISLIWTMCYSDKLFEDCYFNDIAKNCIKLYVF